MKKRHFHGPFIIVLVIISCLLTSCWDRFELIELGFVQALALDPAQGGDVRLTTQVSKPMSEIPTTTSYENIETQAATIPEAVRDIPLKLGRKAKWDHMQVLLISEQLVKQRNLFRMLDFFRRGYEPRGTILIALTKGNARDYLNKKTLIDQTTGRYLNNILEKSFQFNAKAIPTTLFDFDKSSLSEVGVAMLPYLHIKQNNTLTIEGVALIKNGKIMDIIPVDDVKKLLMLTNQHRGGSLEIPCAKEENQKESFEIQTVQTRIQPMIQGSKPMIHIYTKIQGSPFHLRCHSLKTPEEERHYAHVVEQTVQRKLQSMMETLKRKKLDAIGIGNKIYYQNPQRWKKWKENWDEIFAQSDCRIHVSVQITNKGMSGPGNPQ